MTDSDRPSRPTPLSFFRRITLPQAIVVIGLAALGVAALVLVPEERLGIAQEIIVALAMLGAGGTLALAPRPKAGDEAPPPARPARLPRRPEGGSVEILDLILFAIVAIGAVVLPMLTGCGASGLAVQARAAAVATSALEAVPPMVEVATAHRIESECGPASAGDVECVQALRVTMAPDLARVDVAMLAAREALLTWVTTLRMLLEVGDGGDVDVLGAVVAQAGRLVVAWPELVAALRPLAIELPDPPLLQLAAAALGGGL